MVSAVRHQKSELFSCSPSAGRPRSARAASILVFHAAIADAIFLFYFINIILKGYGVWGRLTAVEEVVAAVELARHALGDGEGVACEGGDGDEDGGGELDHFVLWVIGSVSEEIEIDVCLLVLGLEDEKMKLVVVVGVEG